MQEVVTTIITSALVASIAGAAVNAWLESRKSKWMTKLDALKIAIDLEGYALECANKIGNHNTAISSQGSAGSLMGSVPNLPEYSVEVGILRPKKRLLQTVCLCCLKN